MAVDHLTVRDEARTEPRAERNHHEILHALGIAVDHLADRCGVGIVRDDHLHAVETAGDIGRNREDAARLVGIRLTGAELPEVGGRFDGSLVEVGVRGADADAGQLVLEREARGQGPHRIAQILDVGRIVVHKGVFLGRNDRFGIEVSVFVHQAESRVDTSNIDADCEFFHG